MEMRPYTPSLSHSDKPLEIASIIQARGKKKKKKKKKKAEQPGLRITGEGFELVQQPLPSPLPASTPSCLLACLRVWRRARAARAARATLETARMEYRRERGKIFYEDAVRCCEGAGSGAGGGMGGGGLAFISAVSLRRRWEMERVPPTLLWRGNGAALLFRGVEIVLKGYLMSPSPRRITSENLGLESSRRYSSRCKIMREDSDSRQGRGMYSTELP